jgi:hypothetical protein
VADVVGRRSLSIFPGFTGAGDNPGMREFRFAATVLAFILPFAACLAAAAQTTQEGAMAKDADPSFEVATIRPSDPNNTRSGFHDQGHRISCE